MINLRQHKWSLLPLSLFVIALIYWAGTAPLHFIVDYVRFYNSPIKILSPYDTYLYRKAFAAQKNGDFQGADEALRAIDNKVLLGHILADRYHNQRPASIAPLQSWLESYNDHPEADEIYSLAQKMDSAATLKKPIPSKSWVGMGHDGDSGFTLDTAPGKHRHGKINFETKHLNREIKKLLRQGHVTQARKILDKKLKSKTIKLQDKVNAQALIAKEYFYRGKMSVADNLALASAETNNPLGLWIAGLGAWQRGDIQSAADFFTQLAQQPRLSRWDFSAAAFWAYRALDRLDKHEEAKGWLDQAARNSHSFYGIIAAHLRGQKIAPSWSMPKITEKGLIAIHAQKAGERGLALLQAGEKQRAEQELATIDPRGNRLLQEILLAIASSYRLPALALDVGSVATRADGSYYDAALYPLPPWKPENGFQINRAFAFALMRQESQFNPRAESANGACGLMQIMPTTAQMVSDNADNKGCTAMLLNPSYNMTLGQQYIRHLRQDPMIGDNLLMVLAAYNGGPGRAVRQYDEKFAHDPLLFIETFPVHETRNYIQRVLKAYWMYQIRLDMAPIALDQIAHNQWPRD